MNLNIFKRVAALEVRVLIAESNTNQLEKALAISESNVLQLYKAFNTAMLRVTALENNTPRSLSEAEVKKRLKAAAYSRNYYKNKKAASAARDTP
jgi:hypothetical protein